MAHKLLLATRNKGKIEEFRRILDAVAPGEIDLVGLDQFPDLHDVIEMARPLKRMRSRKHAKCR